MNNLLLNALLADSFATFGHAVPIVAIQACTGVRHPRAIESHVLPLLV